MDNEGLHVSRSAFQRGVGVLDCTEEGSLDGIVLIMILLSQLRRYLTPQALSSPCLYSTCRRSFPLDMLDNFRA